MVAHTGVINLSSLWNGDKLLQGKQESCCSGNFVRISWLLSQWALPRAVGSFPWLCSAFPVCPFLSTNAFPTIVWPSQRDIQGANKDSYSRESVFPCNFSMFYYTNHHFVPMHVARASDQTILSWKPGFLRKRICNVIYVIKNQNKTPFLCTVTSLSSTILTCLRALQPYWENIINGNSSLDLFEKKKSGKGGWEWPETYEKEEMSAQIKSSPREDYKFSEKQINNDVNYVAANTTISILKIFFSTTSLGPEYLEHSAIDKPPLKGQYFNEKVDTLRMSLYFQYRIAQKPSLPSPPIAPSLRAKDLRLLSFTSDSQTTCHWFCLLPFPSLDLSTCGSLGKTMTNFHVEISVSVLGSLFLLLWMAFPLHPLSLHHIETFDKVKQFIFVSIFISGKLLLVARQHLSSDSLTKTVDKKAPGTETWPGKQNQLKK